MKCIHHYYDLTQIIPKYKDTWVYIPVQYHTDFTAEDFTSDVNEPGAFTTLVKYSSNYLQLLAYIKSVNSTQISLIFYVQWFHLDSIIGLAVSAWNRVLEL